MNTSAACHAKLGSYFPQVYKNMRVFFMVQKKNHNANVVVVVLKDSNKDNAEESANRKTKLTLSND